MTNNASLRWAMDDQEVNKFIDYLKAKFPLLDTTAWPSNDPYRLIELKDERVCVCIIPDTLLRHYYAVSFKSVFLNAHAAELCRLFGPAEIVIEQELDRPELYEEVSNELIPERSTEHPPRIKKKSFLDKLFGR